MKQFKMPMKNKTTFADRMIAFNKQLNLQVKLPKDIKVMNPFKENKDALSLSSTFYKKFYDDDDKRRMVIGINPGRHGAAITGVPFTDPKRLRSVCGINSDYHNHEPSSVFIYDMIEKYGGVDQFYKNFYINSVSPLGFIHKKNDKWLNYNYYDSKELQKLVTPFIISTLQKQLNLGIDSETCFCLGSGKNLKFLHQINEKHSFFKSIIPLEHPRYIQQYKSKYKSDYIDKYVSAFAKG
ncbi:uracil-DNA glycosylase family protein [Nonlabens antarcticus]|uniref:uracil-DNA glycosylase family protein n=1 Tax=Nonlabens antarcticus TaxID=392714 RepID=UPI001E408014|nr:uracil-DNA glycosylase family protein [Nonlabens antarcticus]